MFGGEGCAIDCACYCLDMSPISNHVKNRTRRTRIKPGLTDGARWRLFETGWRALNDADHEAVSVVAITKAAGCSVGVFYARFADKGDFLDFVVRERFRRAVQLAGRDLHPVRWSEAGPKRRARGIVTHLVQTLHGGMVGVARTAIKRSNANSMHLAPLNAYRAATTESAIVLLLGERERAPEAEIEIRAALQVVIAAVLDGISHAEGPLKQRTLLTVNVLSDLLAERVHAAERHREKFEGENELIEVPIEDVQQVPPAELLATIESGEQPRSLLVKPLGRDLPKPRPAGRKVKFV